MSEASQKNLRNRRTQGTLLGGISSLLAKMLNRVAVVGKTMQAMTEAELLALPSAVDLTTAGRAFGIGRTKAFELVRAGEFPVKVLRVGRKFRVPKAEILEALGVTPALLTGESGPASRRLTFPAHLGRDILAAKGEQLPAGSLDQPNPHGRPGRLQRSTWPGRLARVEAPTPFPAGRTGGPS